jgi:hypothetical protein
MNFAGAQRLTIRRVTTTDLGKGQTSESITSRSWRAMVSPRIAPETADSQSPRAIDGRTLYGEATALDADDRIVIGGVEYEIDGIPASWPWPSGGVAGLVVDVKRAAGSDGS